MGRVSEGSSVVGSGLFEKALIGLRNLCRVVIGLNIWMLSSFWMYNDCVVALKVVVHFDRR